MVQTVPTILFALFVWYSSTGAILYLDGLPTRTYRWSMLGMSAALAASLYGMAAIRSDTSQAGAYVGFTCGVVAWAWQEMAFLMGFATGPRRLGCTQTGWRHFRNAVAAILYHRRAGFSANGMGVWKVPEDQILEVGGVMAATRGISHCYQRPTYDDWPYSVFTMAHGRSKEECDAILDSIAEATGITERSTLYSSTEFKKIRLLYFTDEFRDWERRNAGV